MEERRGLNIMPTDAESLQWNQPAVRGSSYTLEQRHEDIIAAVKTDGCQTSEGQKICEGCEILIDAAVIVEPVCLTQKDTEPKEYPRGS